RSRSDTGAVLWLIPSAKRVMSAGNNTNVDRVSLLASYRMRKINKRERPLLE
ncbi:hypothetical protein Q604_UNBC14743G0001, partial [human gut metagenome]